MAEGKHDCVKNLRRIPSSEGDLYECVVCQKVFQVIECEGAKA